MNQYIKLEFFLKKRVLFYEKLEFTLGTYCSKSCYKCLLSSILDEYERNGFEIIIKEIIYLIYYIIS